MSGREGPWGERHFGRGLTTKSIFQPPIGYFAVNQNQESAWRRAVAPTVAALGLGAVLVVTLAQFHVLLGVSADSPWRWIFPGSYLAVGVVGMVWALILRATRPDVYLAIGLGAHTATPTATSPTGIYASA